MYICTASPRGSKALIVLLSALLLVSEPSWSAQGKSSPAPKPSASALAARDRQDLDALRRHAEESERTAKQQGTASSLSRAALLRSYEAEVALELADKAKAAEAAEKGIALAEQAVKKAPDSADNHRILGVLCGQIIPANLLMGVRYGTCARDEIETALRLDSRSVAAHIGRGVGNYYLPEAFGGGLGKAINDFRYALSLDAKNADAWLWLGLALRRQGNNPEARKALEQAQALAPNRIWIQKQLAKTPK